MKPFVVLVGLLALTAPTRAACDNPYFPAMPGSVRSFVIKAQSKTYTIRVTNSTASGFTLCYEYTDPVRVLESPYTCTP